MNSFCTCGSEQAQRGIALATALIFLVVITVLGLVAVRSSTTELRLASNEQVRVEALQTAQSVVDAVLAVPANTPVNGNIDYRRCFSSGGGGTQTACPNEDAGLTLASHEPPEDDEGGNEGGGENGGNGGDNGANGNDCALDANLFETGVYAEARRLAPANVPVPGQLLTSMDKFEAAGFSIRGQYACGNSGLGSADIEQGLLILVPKLDRVNQG